MMHPYASRRRFRDHSWLENPIFWKYTNSVNGMSSLCQLQRYQKYLTTQSRFPAESISPTADHGPATSSPGTSINKSSSKSFQNWYSSTFLNFFFWGGIGMLISWVSFESPWSSFELRLIRRQNYTRRSRFISMKIEKLIPDFFFVFFFEAAFLDQRK